MVSSRCTRSAFFHDWPARRSRSCSARTRAVPIGGLYRRRSLHELVGFYDESLPVVGDWEFNMRAASVADDIWLCWCGQPLHTGRCARTRGGLRRNSVKRQADHARFDLMVVRAPLSARTRRRVPDRRIRTRRIWRLTRSAA